MKDNRPLSQGEVDALVQALSSTPEDVGGDTAIPPSTPAAGFGPSRAAAAPSAPDSHRTGPPPSTVIGDQRMRRTMHLPVTLFVSLGEKQLPIRSLLNWGIGTQVALDREWQREISIKINGLEVGQGRVVIVGNNFGIEVTAWGRAE